MKNISQLGEFGLINFLKSKTTASSDVIKGIGDDTAVTKFPSQKNLLFTTDMLSEGVHFNKKMSPQGVGYKSICCSVSDIAAMGGTPKYAVVSMGMAKNEKMDYVAKIYKGMQKAAKEFGVDIVGGDTIKSSKMVINVALVGQCNPKKIVYRSGAKVGDKIFVTGALGNSLKSGWHLKFKPRVDESQYLIKNYKVNAMMDVSDGLVGDLNHILDESSVGAVLYESNIPLRKGAAIKNAYFDGEDFELLFTVSPKDAAKILSDSHYKFYLIGEILEKKNGLLSVDGDGIGRRIKSAGSYTHF